MANIAAFSSATKAKDSPVEKAKAPLEKTSSIPKNPLVREGPEAPKAQPSVLILTQLTGKCCHTTKMILGAFLRIPTIPKL